MLQVLADTITKKNLKMSLHILAFQNIPSIFYFFPTKAYIFLADKSFAPPPLTDMSAKNVSFFGRLAQDNRLCWGWQ